MQRPRHDQGEIRRQRAEARGVLDPADQRLVRRMILEDDGSARLAAVADDDVDLVAAKGRNLLHQLRHRRYDRAFGRGPARRQEIVGVLEDVVLDCVEISGHLGQVGIGFPELVEGADHRLLP